MSATLRQTPLHDAHVALGARMVPFAGWEMPVQYEGVIPEHVAVRTRAGAFDVSHMGQLHVDGPAAQAFLQSVLSNDVDRVADGGAQYTLLTTETGGIVDDLIVYRLGHGAFLLVVNAGNRDAAYAWLKEREPRGVEVRDASEEYALVAVQGPSSLELLGLDEAPAFTHSMGELAGVETMICRTGYTGERGVELLCPAEDGVALWDAVLERGVVPCGLAARNTLRLEAAFRLYGNDMDQTTTPLEAGLGWTVKLPKGPFIGREVLVQQKAEGLKRKMVGFEVLDKAPARDGYPVIVNGVEVGSISSGSPAPYLKKNIGLVYLPIEYSAIGTEFFVVVRGRNIPARVVETPFYKRERKFD